ncbi:MAG TPA: cyclic nucleotide-binding domain-containing protein [Acidimicrobiales bacterium]|nr:cyclic nucleotide-binding domain-containing protein [Acidimicrobiales bacterium]
MRIESSVTALSWIPSEAITKLGLKLPFEFGVAHYDEPPPDVIEDLEALRDADRFRFANVLRAWVEVADSGKVVSFGYSGGAVVGSTTLKLGKRAATFAGVALPEIQREPEVNDNSVTFTQTAGGRTGVPAPRRVSHPPFVQVSAPTAWSTLKLTVFTDGRVEPELVGASPFPRHWVYGDDGTLIAKTGLIDFTDWYRHAFDDHTPWGDQDSPALVTAVESALERELSKSLMRDAKPNVRKVKEGAALVRQGEQGHEMFLLLDGVLSVEVDGERLTELGPGALIGERALLEGGERTATLTALTKCRVAVIDPGNVDPAALSDLAQQHTREERA